MAESNSMPDQPEIVTISINGSAGEHDPTWRAEDSGRQAHDEREIVYDLNKNADKICAKIEQQIKKLLGPNVSVQAELSFSAGSIVIAGTVALVYWTGNIVLDSLAKELAELMRVPIKRVLADALTGLGGNASRLEIDTAVRSRAASRASPTLAPETPGSPIQLPWINIAILIITVSVAFLALDRMLSDWPNRPLPAASSHIPP